MIDRETRNEVAMYLGQLVSGDITTDEFEGRLYCWLRSKDSAVAVIGKFGYGLYGEGLLPYRLKGRYAVTEEVRDMADRAILLLQTDLNYQWPKDFERSGPYWRMWGPGFYLPIGLVLLLTALCSLVDGGLHALLMGVMGLLCLAPTFHWLFIHQKSIEAEKRFYASGDFSVWPFLRRQDYETALNVQNRPIAESGSIP
jgi:hypothetical protein